MSEPLGLLLLPSKLEEFELADHARDLLEVPRVVALEPGRFRTPRLLRQSAPIRAARRLQLPGEPRLLVLYDPGQYPLARALCARHEQAELWYFPPALSDRGEALDLDRLARARAGESRVIGRSAEPSQLREPIRARLRELEIISPYPFVPHARIGNR